MELPDYEGVSLHLDKLYQGSILKEVARMIFSSKASSSEAEERDWIKEHERQVTLNRAAGFLGSAILKQLIKEPSVEKIRCITISTDERKLLPESLKIVIYMGDL
ncbi:hypothetical protein QQZ08_012369 [Neonectria magnoliae]|uniref:Alcohol-forming fatty acyl-CoA reductase n=1 Tax=Neonectria magnoliae TaxID=2732573 RepID=A0ABR1H2L5_9HYPO